MELCKNCLAAKTARRFFMCRIAWRRYLPPVVDLEKEEVTSLRSVTSPDARLGSLGMTWFFRPRFARPAVRRHPGRRAAISRLRLGIPPLVPNCYPIPRTLPRHESAENDDRRSFRPPIFPFRPPDRPPFPEKMLFCINLALSYPYQKQSPCDDSYSSFSAA